jgi:hypothetical protein
VASARQDGSASLKWRAIISAPSSGMRPVEISLRANAAYGLIPSNVARHIFQSVFSRAARPRWRQWRKGP